MRKKIKKPVTCLDCNHKTVCKYLNAATNTFRNKIDQEVLIEIFNAEELRIKTRELMYAYLRAHCPLYQEHNAISLAV